MGKTRTPADDRLAEGLRYEKAGLLDKALEVYRGVRATTSDAAVEAESWTLEAFVHHARGDWDAAERATARALELAREAGRWELVGEALNARATVHYSRGELPEAQRLFLEILELSEDPRVRGLALQNLGSLHGLLGELERSERRLEEADRHFQEAGYDWGRAHVNNNRAALALERAEFVAAEGASRRAAHVAQVIEDLDLLAIARMNLAEALAGQGRLAEAESEASQALGQFEVSGNAWRRVACMRILGDLSARQGDPALAERMWRRGLALARQIGATVEAAQIATRLEVPGEPVER